MKLIVISNPVNLNNEHVLLSSLFENGLEYFHLRKPNFTSQEIEAYIQKIPAEYLNKIVLHSHHHLVDKYGLKGKHQTSANISVKNLLADNTDERRNITEEKYKTLHTSAKISEISVKELFADNADECRIENFISTSFHSTDEIMARDYSYEYAFLSPVFDSISKKEYTSKFNKEELNFFLNNYNKKMELIALGGVNEKTIPKAIDTGFDGVAVLGAIWNNEDPEEKFKKLKSIIMLNKVKHV